MAICAIGIYIGFDLKKPKSWFYILCGFVMGFALGLTKNDWRTGIEMGIVFAILVAYAGTMAFKQRQFFGDQMDKTNRLLHKK